MEHFRSLVQRVPLRAQKALLAAGLAGALGLSGYEAYHGVETLNKGWSVSEPAQVIYNTEGDPFIRDEVLAAGSLALAGVSALSLQRVREVAHDRRVCDELEGQFVYPGDEFPPDESF